MMGWEILEIWQNMYIDSIHGYVCICLAIQVLRELRVEHELNVIVMLHPFTYTYIS